MVVNPRYLTPQQEFFFMKTQGRKLIFITVSMGTIHCTELFIVNPRGFRFELKLYLPEDKLVNVFPTTVYLK